MPDSNILRRHTVNDLGYPRRSRTVLPSDTRQRTTGQMMALLEGYAHWGPAYGHLNVNAGAAEEVRESPARAASGYAAALSADTAAVQPAVASPGWIVRLWRWLQREHDIARCIRQLDGLDDRTLRDLGMHRSEIGHVVRHGRDSDDRFS